MMYVNLIWAWGHPEVYILILPAFGIFSEVVSTFSAKRLFGYVPMVAATLAIAVLSFLVWLHHFFTMGAGGDVNGFFGIATMIIAVPTGVKVFNWLFTMYRGRIRFPVPILWTIGFMITFVIGGMTGVLLAVPPADFVLHNSLFLVAHFHNTIIGGVVFGLLAGFNYWFPKAFGFRLNERLGRCAFWCWFVGFYLAFIPLYIVGLMGMTRRIHHYDNPDWHPFMIVAAVGGGRDSVRDRFSAGAARGSHRATGEHPRPDRRSVERPHPGMGDSSPPPAYNFAEIPIVTGRDAFWEMKKRSTARQTIRFQKIHMPRATSAGLDRRVLLWCSVLPWSGTSGGWRPPARSGS